MSYEEIYDYLETLPKEIRLRDNTAFDCCNVGKLQIWVKMFVYHNNILEDRYTGGNLHEPNGRVFPNSKEHFLKLLLTGSEKKHGDYVLKLDFDTNHCTIGYFGCGDGGTLCPQSYLYDKPLEECIEYIKNF